MTKILKGDTSPAIQFVLAEGFNYTGATVEVVYQGARRLFTEVAAGDILRVEFTAEETAVMVLGAWPVTVRVRTASGRFFTVPTGGVKVLVSDDTEAVYPDGAVVISVHGGLFGIEGLPERYTDEDLKAKIGEIIRRLGGDNAEVEG